MNRGGRFTPDRSSHLFPEITLADIALSQTAQVAIAKTVVCDGRGCKEVADKIALALRRQAAMRYRPKVSSNQVAKVQLTPLRAWAATPRSMALLACPNACPPD